MPRDWGTHVPTREVKRRLGCMGILPTRTEAEWLAHWERHPDMYSALLLGLAGADRREVNTYLFKPYEKERDDHGTTRASQDPDRSGDSARRAS